MNAAKPIDEPNLTGQVFVVTGGTRGLGREAVKRFCSLGATVIFTGRSMMAATSLKKEMFEKYPKNRLEFVRCDHNSFPDIINLADLIKAHFTSINCLYHNVGGVFDRWPYRSEDDVNSTIHQNYLSHFLQTDQLYPQLKATEHSRIVMCSSLSDMSFGIPPYIDPKFDDIFVEKRRPDPMNDYFRSKLYQMCFVKGLQKYIEKKKDNILIVCSCSEPAKTSQFEKITELGFKKYFTYCCCFCCNRVCKAKKVHIAVRTNLFVSLQPIENLTSGALYVNDEIVRMPYAATTENNINLLWNQTINLLQKSSVDLSCFKHDLTNIQNDKNNPRKQMISQWPLGSNSKDKYEDSLPTNDSKPLQKEEQLSSHDENLNLSIPFEFPTDNPFQKLPMHECSNIEFVEKISSNSHENQVSNDQKRFLKNKNQIKMLEHLAL